MIDPWAVMTALRLEDGRVWADAATELQLADARAAIEGAEPFGYWTRSRGYSKTGDAAGVLLSLLIAAPPGARLYWLAADADQGTLAIDSITGYADRTPILHGQIDLQARRVVMPTTGARIEVLAADAASSWGLRPYALVVDEFSAWGDTPGPRRLWESVSSAAAKLPDARMLVVTSAGDPRSLAFRMLEHARTSPLWRVSEAEGPSPWMDRGRLDEQRARLPEPVFRALFLNQWIEAEGAFLDPDAVRRAFVLPGPSGWIDGRRYVGALDIGLVNDRTVMAVGHREGPAIVLDLLRTWQGTRANPVDLAEVRDAILSAHETFGLGVLRFDRWQAHRLAEELSAAGMTTEPFEFTAPAKQRLSAALLQAVNEGTLRLYEPGRLKDELLGLTIRTTGAGWSFDHTRRGHDDQAVALSLLILELLTEQPMTAGSFSTIPKRGSDRVIRRAGLTLVGEKYLDREPTGPTEVLPPTWAGSIVADGTGRRSRTSQLVPPPGWREDN